MTVSVFVGTSVDGFIARPNGALDFLPPGGGEPHGYNEFIATVDAIVIGRKTFETVLAMESWPYGDKRVVVLSSHPVDSSGARALKRLVTIELLLREIEQRLITVDRRLALRDDGMLLSNLRLDIVDISLRTLEIGVGDIEGDLKISRIQLDQQSVARDLGIVVDV